MVVLREDRDGIVSRGERKEDVNEEGKRENKKDSNKQLSFSVYEGLKVKRQDLLPPSE